MAQKSILSILERVRGSSKRMKRQRERRREREKNRVARKEDRRKKNTRRSSHRCADDARELKK